jgi:hypothetical protein
MSHPEFRALVWECAKRPDFAIPARQLCHKIYRMSVNGQLGPMEAEIALTTRWAWLKAMDDFMLNDECH